jgi:hypothetical protein
MVAQGNLLASSIIFLDAIFYFHFFSKILLVAFLFLQLEIEALKLFDETISDFSLVVRKVLDVISLSTYIY